jgi:ATP-dependent RNA helicase DeaD
MELTSAAIRAVLEAGDFERYRVLVEALGGDFALVDVAAAAVKLAHEARSPEVSEVPIAVPASRETEPDERPRRRTGGAPSTRGPRDGGAPRPSRAGATGRDRPAKRRAPAGDGADGEFVRLYVPLGRRAGVRPADLVGAIANEARIDARRIGAIDIADSFSLVEVPERDADSITDALRATTIRGKNVRVRRERF